MFVVIKLLHIYCYFTFSLYHSDGHVFTLYPVALVLKVENTNFYFTFSHSIICLVSWAKCLRVWRSCQNT